MTQTHNEVSSSIVKMTTREFSDKLKKERTLSFKEGETLILQDIELNDFIEAASTSDLKKKVEVLAKILSHHSLNLNVSGSLELGNFDLRELSWRLSPSKGHSLQFVAEPLAIRKSLDELVQFLSLLPESQGFVLKPFQKLVIEGLPTDALLDYYNYCQDNPDPSRQEKGQDDLFRNSSELLLRKNALLKVFAINATRIDRNIDTQRGSLTFSARGDNPSLVVAVSSLKKQG